MKERSSGSELFGTESIGKVLLKIAPPVMLAQLIQALYNIVDSFFVGKYSDDALTAITVIYPLQLIIIAVAVGTGVGVNTYMARKYALGEPETANATAGTGTVLALVSWAVFALISFFIMPAYVKTSASEAQAIGQAVTYGRIVCVGSIGTFLEGNWSKVHQARGNMKLPMIAQVAGALTNIILDPILIFGLGPTPEMGVAGAAYATVAGQVISAVITGIRGFSRPPALSRMLKLAGQIYRCGYSSILMQALYTVYIVMLNMILSGFSDAAVTVLGLYYKLQSFFFIPLFGLQTCIVPVLSYNCAKKAYRRCRETMRNSFIISLVFMLLGTVCFLFIPETLIRLFSNSAEVIKDGVAAFPIIGCSFFAAVFSLIMPTFFQAIGKGLQSLLLSLTRQIFALVPVFWLLSKIGLNYAWIAFPVAEVTAGTIGMILYIRQLRKWKREEEAAAPPSPSASAQ